MNSRISLHDILTTGDIVKLCLANRPWPILGDRVKDRPSLPTGDLTLRDIGAVTLDKLAAEYNNPFDMRISSPGELPRIIYPTE